MKRLAAGLLVFAACAAPIAAGEQVGRYEWTGVNRVVAVGDVHGSYEKLVDLLAGVHLIDDSQEWIGGADHLVLVGDLIDRGAGDRAVLDLLYKLQQQAPESGGRVHVLIGNHEVLNLVRDLRYVNPDGYADFAAEEDPKSRTAGFRRFKRRYEGPDPEIAFEKMYPPGYFARIAAFNPDGQYGKWLKNQPVVVKVNDALFVHGGLTERVASLGLNDINRQVMSTLAEHLRVRRKLEARNIVDSMMTFRQAQQATAKFVRRNHSSLAARSWVEAANDFGRLAESELFGVEGPLWYRGNALENERIERERLWRTLEILGSRVLVVAHSTTSDEKIKSRFGGRLYRIDHGMAYGGQPQALILKERMARKFVLGVEDLAEVPAELPHGENDWAHIGDLTDNQVVELLSHGKIVASRDLGRGSTRPKLVELENGETKVRAIFKTVDERPGSAHDGQALDRHRQEVAAYRLDRFLGLGLVPVTVLREVDGVEGSMQQWVEHAIDGETKREYGLVAEDPMMMARESDLGLAFEYLIGNASRSERDLLYLLDESRVMCVDHSRTFPTATIDSTLPEFIEPRFLESIEKLNETNLEEILGDLLTVGQIKALLQRRDRVLDRYDWESDSSVGTSGGNALASQRHRTVRARIVSGRGSLAPEFAQAAAGAPSPQDWTAEQKERFLAEAEVVDTAYIGSGVTRPKRVTLELDGVTLDAAFKYHEEFRPGVTQFDEGPREVNFRDSYLFDRAAYLLDKELGMGMVPPTVLRDVEGEEGALVWWVADSISEVERVQRKIWPGDPDVLRHQQDVARLFYALVENTDENLHNQLVTVRTWKLHLIDLTRAFRFSKDLPKDFEETPITLPRDLYQRLQDLDRERLLTVMAGVLSKTQIKMILTRRDAILAKIERDIETKGEEAVFQD